MAAATARILLRKPSDKTADLPTAAPSVEAPTPAKTAPAGNGAQAGRKVMIRWLPPGMKASEFDRIMGADWAAGQGKVDWTRFRDGKVARK